MSAVASPVRSTPNSSDDADHADDDAGAAPHPRRRSSRAKAIAISAVKIGDEPTMMPASDEGIRSWP